VKSRPIGIAVVCVLCWLVAGCGYNQLQHLEENAYSAWEELDSRLEIQTRKVAQLLAAIDDHPWASRPAAERLAAARAASATAQISVEELATPPVLAHFQQVNDALSVALADFAGQAVADPNLQTEPSVFENLRALASLADEIIAARERYNMEVKRFNSAIRQFPFDLTNRLLLGLKAKGVYTARVATEMFPFDGLPTQRDKSDG